MIGAEGVAEIDGGDNSAVARVHLSDILDKDRLDRLMTDGMIARRHHPSAALSIYDYTRRASYARSWPAETRLCRGLITDRDGYLVARPFAKFFSVAEHMADPALDRIPDGAGFEISDKIDGSLGILHDDGGGPAIATRGSFDSPQARWATEHYRAQYAGLNAPPGVTYLFEIVYPANRIVVDYGPFAGLVLLAAIDIATGADVALPDDWPGPVVGCRTGAGTLDDVLRLCGAMGTSALDDLLRPGHGQPRPTLAGGAYLGPPAPPAPLERPGAGGEGYVVRITSPARPSLRLKVKFPDYVRLHHLLTEVSTRTIWQRLSTGQPLDDLLDAVPTDFTAWVQQAVAELRDAYGQMETQSRAAFAECRVDRDDRPAAAGEFRSSGANAAVLFKMLDRRPYDQIIWRAIRPPPGGVFKLDPAS